MRHHSVVQLHLPLDRKLANTRERAFETVLKSNSSLRVLLATSVRVGGEKQSTMRLQEHLVLLSWTWLRPLRIVTINTDEHVLIVKLLTLASTVWERNLCDVLLGASVVAFLAKIVVDGTENHRDCRTGRLDRSERLEAARSERGALYSVVELSLVRPRAVVGVEERDHTSSAKGTLFEADIHPVLWQHNRLQGHSALSNRAQERFGTLGKTSDLIGHWNVELVPHVPRLVERILKLDRPDLDTCSSKVAGVNARFGLESLVGLCGR